MELNDKQKATLKALNLEVVGHYSPKPGEYYMDRDGWIIVSETEDHPHRCIVRPTPAVKLPETGSAAWALAEMVLNNETVTGRNNVRYRYHNHYGRFERNSNGVWWNGAPACWDMIQPFHIHTEPPPPPTLAELKAAWKQYKTALHDESVKTAWETFQQMMARIPDATEVQS